jgi:hypothetical protein
VRPVHRLQAPGQRVDRPAAAYKNVKRQPWSVYWVFSLRVTCIFVSLLASAVSMAYVRSLPLTGGFYT